LKLLLQLIYQFKAKLLQNQERADITSGNINNYRNSINNMKPSNPFLFAFENILHSFSQYQEAAKTTLAFTIVGLVVKPLLKLKISILKGDS